MKGTLFPNEAIKRGMKIIVKRSTTYDCLKFSALNKKLKAMALPFD